MTELTCDNYFIQLETIKSLSTNSNTTKLQLEQAYNLLETYAEDFNDEILVNPIPSTFIHLDKVIMVRHYILSNCAHQSFCIDLIELKKKALQELATNNASSQDINDMETELVLIQTYYNTVLKQNPEIKSFINRVKYSVYN